MQHCPRVELKPNCPYKVQKTGQAHGGIYLYSECGTTPCMFALERLLIEIKDGLVDVENAVEKVTG